MKRVLAVMLALMLLMAGCSIGHDTADDSEEAANPLGDQPLEFYYSSGAGGWSTQLVLQPDGSFTGHYEDRDLGATGEENPNGTLYYCDFSGSFAAPGVVNEYQWTMVLEYLQTEQEAGAIRYEDGVACVSTGPVGLEHAGEVWLYLPGTETDTLPEEFLAWTTSAFSGEIPDQLPFYGLYSPGDESGFVGYPQQEQG